VIPVYAELCQIVEEWIEILETDGHPLPEPLGGKKSCALRDRIRLDRKGR